MEIKSFPLKVKAGPDDGLEEGQFVGYASVFGNVDSHGDVVVKGAFANTLAKWSEGTAVMPALWGHDMFDPFSNIGGVAEAEEDDHGLKITAQLDLDNPTAVQVYRLLKGRRINQMSFAYTVLDSGPVEVDGQKATELRELELHEVSIVPMGANAETEIVSVKNAAERLTSGIKSGRVLEAKHIDSLRAAQDAIGAVIAAAEATDIQEGKASDEAQVKCEEPSEVKHEEPTPVSPVNRLALELQLLSLQ